VRPRGIGDDAAAKSGARFVASLPQGTIELVAVSRSPSTNERSWKPDGSDSDDGRLSEGSVG